MSESRRSFFTKLLGGVAAAVMASPLAKALGCAKRTLPKMTQSVYGETIPVLMGGHPKLAWDGALLQVTRMIEEDGKMQIRARRYERLADDPRHIALIKPESISSFSVTNGGLYALDFTILRYKAIGLDPGDLIQILKEEDLAKVSGTPAGVTTALGINFYDLEARWQGLSRRRLSRRAS